MEDIIRKFLELQGDSGFGDGEGSGSGSGFGLGSGDGSGSGFGNGNGSGDGSGSGDGYGPILGLGLGLGSGSGSGSGFGDGDGDGDGSGSGFGSSFGLALDFGLAPGSGSGFGLGSGDGDRKNGVSAFDGHTVYSIDDIPTLIDRVHGNVARGAILNMDLTTRPCYIVKNERCFAHGTTLEEAQAALREKIIEDMDPDEAIEKFMEIFDSDTEEYPASKFYEWHHYLTGSCKAGRDAFARDHDIDVSSDALTVRQFLDLTQDTYGRDIIKSLKQQWDKKYGRSRRDTTRHRRISSVRNMPHDGA